MPPVTENAHLDKARTRHGYAVVWLAASFIALVLALFFMIGPSGGVDAAPTWQTVILGAICLSFGWSVVDVALTAYAFYTQREKQDEHPTA